MVGDDQRDAGRAEAMRLAAQFADRGIGRQQVLGGDSAHRQNEARANQRDLPLQKRQATGRLSGGRIAVCLLYTSRCV